MMRWVDLVACIRQEKYRKGLLGDLKFMAVSEFRINK